MARQKQRQLNPGEAQVLKATIYDLSGPSAKQVLCGIVKVLSLKTSVSLKYFEEIIDDARRLTEVKKKQGEI